MKGIILAGGHGTRLLPLTKAVNKHLLPVYDKPMIFYPLLTFQMLGIHETLMVLNTEDLSQYQQLLGDGSDWEMKIHYLHQSKPLGLAHGLILAEPFIQNESFYLMLGDNFFQGAQLKKQLMLAQNQNSGVTTFSIAVPDPRAFGVVTRDETGEVMAIEEKPAHPASNEILTGLYYYDAKSIDVAKTLTPSARGELEITALNEIFLKRRQMTVIPLASDTMWLDLGTPETLFLASSWIRKKRM